MRSKPGSETTTGIVRLTERILEGANANELLITEKVLASGVAPGSREAATRTGLSRQGTHQIALQMHRRLLRQAGKDIGTIANVINRRLGAITDNAHVTATIEETFTPGSGIDNGTQTLARRWIQAATRKALDRKESGVWSVSARGVEAGQELLNLRRQCRTERATTVTGALRIQRRYGLSADELSCLARWTGTRVHRGWVLLTTHLAGMVETTLEERGTPTVTRVLAAAAGCKPAEIQRRAHDWPWLTHCGHSLWALTRWNLQKYKNITTAAVEEIEKHDGKARTQELVRTVAERFGVRAQSVRSYLRTPVFERNNGHVRVADSQEPRLQPLSERVDGFTSSGEPFIVIPIQCTRLLRGFSCNNVPYELAAHAGCEPEGKLRMEVFEPSGCPALTWSWRITSTSGIAIGRLSHVYRKLKLQPGDYLKIIVDRESRAKLVRLPPGSWKPEDSLRKRRPRAG